MLSVAKCFARLLGIWQSGDPTGDFLGSFSPLALDFCLGTFCLCPPPPLSAALLALSSAFNLFSYFRVIYQQINVSLAYKFLLPSLDTHSHTHTHDLCMHVLHTHASLRRGRWWNLHVARNPLFTSCFSFSCLLLLFCVFCFVFVFVFGAYN